MLTGRKEMRAGQDYCRLSSTRASRQMLVRESVHSEFLQLRQV